MLTIIRRIKKIVVLIFRKPHGLWHYLFNLTCYYLKIPYLIGKPIYYTIELTNICDMKCPVCETGAGILKRKKGYMPFEHFKHIIDMIKGYANTIHLYFMGEPFLNQEIYRTISYARQYDIYVTICTNGHHIDAARVIDSGLNEIHFQVGGIDQKTHERYRIGGNFAKTIENMKKLKQERIKRNKNLPKIIFGFIVMKHNEHQLQDVHYFAREAGADEVHSINPCFRTADQAFEMMPNAREFIQYDIEALQRKKVLLPKYQDKKECPWVFNSLVILWNGDIVPCCRDPHGRHVFGNILKDNITHIWNNEKFIHLRKIILSHEKMEDFDLCRLCSGYGIPELH